MTATITPGLNFRPEDFDAIPGQNVPKIGVPRVYGAICAVMAEASKYGIEKLRENKDQHYKFRSIDQVYNALSGALVRAKLLMLPRVVKRRSEERATKSGGVQFRVTVEMEYDLISAEDGSRHTVRTCGEGMDVSDKATNKAMSFAYKYAALQAFCIPVDGEVDGDSETPEQVVPRTLPTPGATGALQPRPQAQTPQRQQPAPQQRQAPVKGRGYTNEQDARLGELTGKLGMSRPAFMDVCKEVTGRMLGADMTEEQAASLIQALEGMLAERGAA
jgi:hypothetical protein